MGYRVRCPPTSDDAPSDGGIFYRRFPLAPFSVAVAPAASLSSLFSLAISEKIVTFVANTNHNERDARCHHNPIYPIPSNGAWR